MTLEELEALPIIGETASGEGSLSPEEVEALPIIGETARAADALSQSEIDALPILPDEGTVFDVDSLPILDDDQPAKKSLGVGGTLAAQAQAETGRDLGALGTAATYVPVVGPVMKADAHREFNNLERLYTGDFRDTLEGSKLLLANGFSQEDVRRVNAAAGFGRRNLLGNYTEFDIDKFRESVKELVKPRFAEMIRIKNAAAQELQNNDLGFLGKAAVGTIGAAGAVAEMANVPLAGVTLMPSAMNRAANMSEGQYALDENGDIVTLKDRGDADAALLKGFGGAAAERAVWMGLGKLTKMGGGALLKQFPGLDKVLGTAVAKGAQGMAAVTAKLSESAAGRVLLGSAKIIGKMQIGAVPGMMVKSRMTELFDDVIGLNVADAEEREALGAWAKKWVSVSDNAELFVELLGVHLGMKAAGLAVKPLRAAAEKIGLADPSFNRKGKEGQEYEKFLAQFIGEEKVKALSDTDLVHLARLLASEHFTAERAEKFLADLTGDLDAAEKKVAAGESLESVLEGLRTRKAITPEYLEAAKAAAAELRDRVTLDDGQTAKITDAALNAAEGNVEIAAKIAADAKTSLRNKRTQVDDPRGLEALIAESTRKFAPEARAVKIHDLKGERDVGRQIGAIESLGVTTADAAVASGIVRRNANGTLEGGARRAVNILENGTEKMREGVKDGTLDAGVAEELITAAHLELGADTPEARAAFMDAVIDAARRLAETEPRHQEQTARRIIEELGRETRDGRSNKEGQGDVAQRVAEAAERARRAIEAEERAEPLEKAAKARESANGAEDLTAVRLTSNNGGVLTCGRFKGVTVRFETLADGVTKEIYVDGLDNRIIADPNRGVDALLLAVELQRLARRTGCQISFDDPLMYEPFKAYLKLADEKGTVEKAQEHLRTRAQLLDLLSRNGLAEGVFYDEISFRRALASDAQGRQFIDNHGDIYGIQLDGNLYFNPAHFDLDIPIHEYGHLAVNLLIDRESALVRRGLELIKDTEYYRRLVEQSETVGHEYEYLRGDENGLRIEALVTMIGDRGGKLVREKGVGAELVQWLKDFWKSFRKALGLEDIPPERVEKMSVNEIVDAINAEMLRGKEFGTRKPLATKETSVRKYDEAEGSGSNGLLRWTQDNGGLFKLPVDLERTQRGGPVHLSTDDANITDFIARALNGRKLMMSQSGKIYVKGENGLPKELALIFGHTPTIGQNDGLGQRLAEELRRPELADATPEQLVEMLRADRTNYAAWKESESRRDGKTLEQRQMEDYYRNQAEAEEAEARTRWEDSGLSLPDYILSRIEDGEAPFDLDWETMREIEHDRAHGRFMVGNKKPWPEDFPKVTVHTTREAIERKHGEIFKKAKAGDADSALELVSKVVKPQKVRDLLAAHPDAQIVAPVYAEEQSGHNQIPAAYAYYIARIAGLKLDESIKQSVRAFHTGADAFARLSRRAEFIGEVVKGGKYILVDDHITQGGTLSELRHYIENGGGEVVAITTLTASKGSTIISIQKPTIEALKAKFGSTLDENLRKANIAGCVEALTESEGRYILKLSPDTFRARCARSEQESREREVCREVRGTVQDAPDSGVSFDGPRFMARDGDGAGFEDSLLVPRRIDKRVLVANGAGHGEQTPGSVAASLERLNQPRTTMQTLGKVNAVSLPLSELDWLRRQIFGDRTPGTIVRRLPGGKTSASTKAGQVMILGGIIGMVDNTDVAPIKERLKEHGFYRNEDPSWANLMKPAEIRHEQERSDHQLADELLKLADRRGRGEEPGGMSAARRIYANELAKIVMELPRRTEGVIGGVQKMGDAVRTEVKAKFPSGGDKETEARKEAESFLSAFDGEATTGANPPRTMRELTDAMFGAWLVMPEEMRKSAPNWYGAILSAVSSDPRLEKAYKDLSFRMLSRDAYKAVFEDVRKSQQRSVDEALAKLEEEGNEPIKAGGWSDSLKEGVVVAFHDRLAPVVMRIDGKAKAYLKARKAVLAEMKRKGASKAEIAAVRQEIDLFMGNIAHLKNRLELSRTAMERGVWNEGRRYMLDMLLLENEASKKWGLTEEDKSAYLDMMRIIETQGRSGSHGMDPRQARLALGDMARRLGAEKWARLEQYGRKFHEIMEREFLNDKRVERMWGKGFVDYLRSQSNYVTTKRTFTPEEMDAIDEARQKLKQSGMSNGDTVIEAMYRYGGANGARETLGENAWTARLTGSMAAKREVRGATWEKQQKLMQAARRNQFVIDLRDALLGANVEGVRDFRRDENEFPDNKRYGRINYVENGVRRVLVVPAQIADGLKTQKDILPWMTKFHGITRGLMIDWNPAYWNRNIMRNSGSIEKNMPRMHESWLKTALRVAPGLSPVVDLAMQHLARHSPRAAKVMGALFGRDTIFPYIQQAKRMATLLEDPTAWQDRLWKAEAKGDAGEVAQMMDDLMSVKEMLCGNMLVPIRKAYNGGKTEGFANDMMGKAGFRMEQQLEADARRTAVGKVLHVLGKPFRANAKQQEWEDVMAKTIAYLHDRARFGLERSVEESGLTVKRNVSIAEGERRGAAAPLIQKTMSQFYNMIEKGVTRSWRAMKERPGETAVKMARTWVGRFVGGVIAGGAVTQWIRSLFDGDEEKIAASPLGDVYDFAKWMELNNRNLSEYVRNHYQTIPVWASEDGYSSIVIGMPLNDEDSFIAPSADFAAKAFVQASGGVTRDLEFGKMLMDSTYRAVVPDFEMSTPTVKIIRDTLLALVDNPTDYFSGAPVYDNDVWTLRNENRERRGAFALAMAKQVWNDIGGRGFMKFDRNGVDTAQGTRTVPSKWIGIAMNNIPVLSPMISSFIKVQVGSPEKDAKPIQEAERRIASIQRVCALQLMEESQKIGGALNRLNPARYAQCLERWQKEYGLTDNQMHKIEQRFLNAWNLHENGDAAAIKTTNRNIRRARRLGREDLERLLIRGDL